MDEARIWNVAADQSQIQSTMNSEITSGTGLIARYGMNEGTGTAVANSIATRASGTDRREPHLGGRVPVWRPAASPCLPAQLRTPVQRREPVRDDGPGCRHRSARPRSHELHPRDRVELDGGGTAGGTGTNGLTNVIPLISKGGPQTETIGLNMNYFLGIRTTDNVLVADFEDTVNGGNHP